MTSPAVHGAVSSVGDLVGIPWKWTTIGIPGRDETELVTNTKYWVEQAEGLDDEDKFHIFNTLKEYGFEVEMDVIVDLHEIVSGL